MSICPILSPPPSFSLSFSQSLIPSVCPFVHSSIPSSTLLYFSITLVLFCESYCILGLSFLYFFPFCLGNSEDHLVPMLVSGLRGYHVIDVACGSGDAHSLAVADDGKNLYTLVSSPFYSKYIVVIDIENSLKFQNNIFL